MNKLITIATYTYPHEMAIMRSKLEANGIECSAKDEFTVQVHNFYSNAIGGVKLQVKETDAERALAILKENNDLAADYSDAKVKCPNCDSGNIDGIGINDKISLMAFLILGFPIPIFSNKCRCYNCHTEFKLAKKN